MLAWLFGPRRNAPIRHHRRSPAKPRLEPLESRLAPANTLYWNGLGASQNMSDPGNYVGGMAVPAAGDTVVFDSINGAAVNTPAVADPALVGNLGAIRLGPGFTGGLRISRDLTVDTLTVNSPVLSIDAFNTLYVLNGTWQTGALNGSGTLMVGEPGVPATLSINGPASMTSASLVVDAMSQLTISADLTLTATNLTNMGGTVNWAAGDITVDNGFITNYGTMLLSAANTMSTGGGGQLTNDGEISVNPGAGVTTTIGLGVVNDGSPFFPRPLEVSSGTLDLTGSVQSWGAVYVNQAATLDVTDFTANPGSVIGGSGTVLVSGTLTAPPDQMNPFNVSAQIEGLLQFGSDPAAVTGGGVLQVGSLQTTGGQIDDVDVTVLGSASLVASGGRAITLTNGTLQLQGQTTWSSGLIRMQNGLISNAGQFDIQSDGSVFDIPRSGSSTFQNTSSGVVQKTSTTLTVFDDVAVTTEGQVLANGRDIRFKWGLTQTGGTVNLGVGGTFDFLGGPGGGQSTTYSLRGGKLVANGTIKNCDLTNSGGTVEILGLLSLFGTYTQQAGPTVLQIDLSQDDWGFFDVSDAITLDGTLALSLEPGYTPADGSVGTVVRASSGALSGTFATTPAGWDVGYIDDTYVTITKQ